MTPPNTDTPPASDPVKHVNTLKLTERVNMGTVTPEFITWIWEGRIAKGKFTLLDGDPDKGKSLITCDLAARLSTGRPMPMEQTATYAPSKVLFLMCEDDLADTMAPRLDAAGADRNNIEVRRGIIQIPEQLDLIEADLVELGAKLLIIDPLTAYLSGKANAHSDHEVRRHLMPLIEMADRLGVAVIGVRHLNKQVGGSAIYRGGGSIAFVGLSRVAMMVGIDPEDKDLRIMAPIKGNLAGPPSSLRYRIVATEQNRPRIEWLGTCDVSADRLVSPPETEADRSALAASVDFLKDKLADGAKPAAELYELAKKEGIADRTLRRARQHMKIPQGKTWTLPAAEGQR